MFHLDKLSEVRSALKIPLSCTISSRALRSLPLSVMMSGVLSWSSGNLSNRGTNGYFRSSTPYAYTASHGLGFNSAGVNPKSGYYKPDGLALRCVARQKKRTMTSSSICPKGWMLPQNDGNQSWYNLLNGTYKYYATEMENGTGNITGGDTLKAIDNDKDSSRALRSLPLSVMLSGYYGWGSGNLIARGTGGGFWASTPGSYTYSRHLYFYSTNVTPKNSNLSKPDGLALRCVARFPPKSPPLFHLDKLSEVRSALKIPCFFAPFLPELSAAFLFRL